ncbi:uncharacterized protein [Anomalospiza imberbis]|uniref:uncharacterized protein n=1 Tax=Anomalospiza imberbis TaxID=187417 RepID=UPI00358F59EA
MRSPPAPAPRGLAECGTGAAPGMGTSGRGVTGDRDLPHRTAQAAAPLVGRGGPIRTGEGSGPRLSPAASAVLCLWCVPPSGRQPQGKIRASHACFVQQLLTAPTGHPSTRRPLTAQRRGRRCQAAAGSRLSPCPGHRRLHQGRGGRLSVGHGGAALGRPLPGAAPRGSSRNGVSGALRSAAELIFILVCPFPRSTVPPRSRAACQGARSFRMEKGPALPGAATRGAVASLQESHVCSARAGREAAPVRGWLQMLPQKAGKKEVHFGQHIPLSTKFLSSLAGQFESDYLGNATSCSQESFRQLVLLLPLCSVLLTIIVLVKLRFQKES